MKGKLINLEELSMFLGVSENSIRKWTLKPEFPVEVKSDPDTRQPWVFNSAKVVQWLREQERQGNDAKGANLRLKNEKLAEEVRKLAIENTKALGEVVYIEDVHVFIRDQFTRIRQAFRTLPGKLAPQLAIETEAGRIKGFMLEQIDNCLLSLSLPVVQDNHIKIEVDSLEEDLSHES